MDDFGFVFALGRIRLLGSMEAYKRDRQVVIVRDVTIANMAEAEQSKVIIYT